MALRRRIPWVIVFEAAMLARDRWKRLPPADRSRLAALARKSRGRPGALTPAERAEFRRIAAGLDLLGLARDLMPFGRRLRGRGRR
jgi:hypothetical protein